MDNEAMSAGEWYRTDAEGIELRIRVIARARQTEFGPVRGNQLVVRVDSPPVAGKANVALRKFLALCFGCRQRDVVLVKGSHVRDKVVRIHAATVLPAFMSLGAKLPGLLLDCGA